MVQHRNVVTCIILHIVTCGLYGILWQIAIADDVNLVSGSNDVGGIGVFLLTILTCGIYGFYWAYRCGEKLDRAKREQGYPSSNSGVLYLLVYIFAGFISYALIQGELNHFTNEIR